MLINYNGHRCLAQKEVLGLEDQRFLEFPRLRKKSKRIPQENYQSIPVCIYQCKFAIT